MIKNKKVHLRAINIKDAEILMELNNNEEIAKYVVGNPSIVNMEQQLKWMTAIEKKKNTKRWMIDFDEQTVGTIILSSIDMNNYVGNMNIKLLPRFQGQGIAKKALIEACNIAFGEMNLDCLTANILLFNEKSKDYLRKLVLNKMDY